MQKIRLVSILLSALAAFAFPAASLAGSTGGADTHHAKLDTVRFVPESDLHAGQIGYALTVFHGTKISRFGVKILGVLKKVNNGKDLILIKVTSGPSVTRHANIAHGMSGSPVYLGKRMVGAIAYSLPFAKEPIGLVTPIEDMLDAWDPDLPKTPSIAMLPGGFGSPSGLGMSAPNSQLAAYLSPTDVPGGLGRADGATRFEALSTPLMVSGMSPRVMSNLATELAPFGLLPMAGGGGGSTRVATAADKASLVPGAAVGVSIVQGDVDMTAIGTLTYRDGNRVIAFGHPFTGIGPIDAAMTTATITDLFPSVQDSIKLGAPDVTVGRIFQDRPFSVGGIIGSMPKMIPVTVNIDDQSDKRTRVFNAKVINHPLLTGHLILNVVNEAMLEVHGSPGDAVALVKMDVDAEQIGHVVRSNVFYDPLNIADTATADLQKLIGLLSANPFYPIGIKDVKFDVTIQSRHDTAQIDHIYVPKVRYQPGDKVDVGVVVKLYKRDPVLQKVSLTIPTSTPNGTVMLVVRGGTPNMEDSAGNRPNASGAAASNIAQLVRKFLDQPKNNEIVASLFLPTTAINVQGEKLSLLPPNFSAVMRSQHSTGLKLERDEVKVVQQVPWVLSGAQTLSITVARKNPLDTPQAQTPPSPSSMPAPVQATAVGGADNVDDTPAELPTRMSNEPTFPQWQVQDTPPALPMPTAPVKPAPPIVKERAASTAIPTVIGGNAHDEAAPDTTSDEKPPKVLPVSRIADTWRQDTSEEFAGGTLENVALTSGNELRLAASPEFFAASTASYIWSLVTDGKGGVYAGTGDDGVIYKADSSGAMTPFFRTNELEVNALAINRQTGEIFAGTAPHGIVFRIGADGKGAKVFTTQEKYITALAVDPARGKLYIATGGGNGRVYSAPLSNVASAAPLWTSQSAHILALAVSSNGTVYASGAPEGVIYAISPTGKESILYATADQNVISGLAVGKDDIVYAGIAPKGDVIKITPADGAGAPNVKHLLSKPIAPIFGVQADKDGNIWAVAGSTIYGVSSDDTVLSHTAATEVQFIAMALSDSGAVYAGTSDIGLIYGLGDRFSASALAQTGTYTSPVHDAKLPSKWGAITWDATTPPGASVVLQTRSGDVTHPDESWSDWSAPYTNAASQQVASPPARYIQYRAVFTGRSADINARASLNSVTLYYLTRNQAPVVKLRDPVGGDDVFGDYTVRWVASDPDHDTLSYDLYYSTDQKDWVLIKPIARTASTKAPITAPSPVTSLTPSNPAPSLAPGKPVAPVGKSPLPPPPPPAMTARSTFAPQPADTHVVAVSVPRPGAAPAAPQANLAATLAPSSAPAPDAHVSATSQKWSTSKLPDGKYYLKVVASDLPSNATDSLSDESIAGPIAVDNTPPVVHLDGDVKVDAKKQVNISGMATGKISFIVAVQYKLDDQDTWSAAAPKHDLLDSTTVGFSLTTPPMASGKHKITVQAINEADNAGIATTTVDVP